MPPFAHVPIDRQPQHDKKCQRGQLYRCLQPATQRRSVEPIASLSGHDQSLLEARSLTPNAAQPHFLEFKSTPTNWQALSLSRRRAVYSKRFTEMARPRTYSSQRFFIRSLAKLINGTGWTGSRRPTLPVSRQAATWRLRSPRIVYLTIIMTRKRSGVL
jgi:hypothetical protein